jgi:hypothetical protein
MHLKPYMHAVGGAGLILGPRSVGHSAHCQIVQYKVSFKPRKSWEFFIWKCDLGTHAVALAAKPLVHL